MHGCAPVGLLALPQSSLGCDEDASASSRRRCTGGPSLLGAPSGGWGPPSPPAPPPLIQGLGGGPVPSRLQSENPGQRRGQLPGARGQQRAVFAWSPPGTRGRGLVQAEGPGGPGPDSAFPRPLPDAAVSRGAPPHPGLPRLGAGISGPGPRCPLPGVPRPGTQCCRRRWPCVALGAPALVEPRFPALEGLTGAPE